MKYLNCFIIIIVALIFNGCSTTSDELAYNLTTWEYRDPIAMTEKTRLTIAIIPFRNETDYTTAADYARRILAGTFVGFKNYEVQSLWKTDSLLKNSVSRANQTPKDYNELYNVLKTDMILFGRVIEQKHKYAFFYAGNSVKVMLELYDAKDGKLLWKATDERSRSVMGISLFTNYDMEYYWLQEIFNRYNELFRDMVNNIPSRVN